MFISSEALYKTEVAFSSGVVVGVELLPLAGHCTVNNTGAYYF